MKTWRAVFFFFVSVMLIIVAIGCVFLRRELEQEKKRANNWEQEVERQSGPSKKDCEQFIEDYVDSILVTKPDTGKRQITLYIN